MAEEHEFHPTASKGMKPYDFVQQVYYAQEKVVLDFWPNDDKYKEVLFEANLILQELQNIEDWTWLRERIILGSCHSAPGAIPEFELPDWVYKISTLNHDCVRLYKSAHKHHHPQHMHHLDHHAHHMLDEHDYISVPLASVGDNQYRKEILMNEWGGYKFPDKELKAIRIGNLLTFNRPLKPFEADRIMTVDVQRKLPLLHICDSTCTPKNASFDFYYTLDSNGEFVNPCPKVEDRIFLDIPDPNYMVMATAARHAEGSPPALARVAGLQDAAQRILSAMRSNDAVATDPDWQDWETPGYFSVY